MIEAKNKYYFETSGYSMWPFLRPQDRIIVERTGCFDLIPGNLIVFESDGNPVCHRLVKKRMFSGKYWLFTRGDYVTCWKTEKVHEAHVTGRVSAIIRGGEILPLQGIWPTVCGRIIILVFPAVAWTVSGLRKILSKK